MSDQELKITIDPDEEVALETAVAAEAKKEAPVEKAAAPEPVDELKAQVDELREGRETERKAREAAERRAAQLEREASEAHQRATASDLSTITTALESEQEKIEQAKKDIRAAKEAGDLDAETDAIDRLTTAKSTYLRLDESKADAEARKKVPPPPKREVVSSDPIAAYIANRTEPTANWLKAHPDYITDARKNDKLTAAHYDAVAEGYAPDSKRYFDHVERYLGLTKDETPPPATEAAQVKPKAEVKRPAPSAPVAPAAAVANGGSAQNEVRLTAGEARAATDGSVVHNWDDPKGKFKKGDPIGVQEYARRKIALQRRGAYDKSYTES